MAALSGASHEFYWSRGVTVTGVNAVYVCVKEAYPFSETFAEIHSLHDETCGTSV